MPSPRHFCSATTAMNGQPKEPHHILTISRRDTLVGGVAVLAGGAITSACTSLALAAIEPSTQDRFMRMSKLLINHQLSPDVGARIVDMAVGQYKDLPGMLDAITASPSANTQPLSRISLATFLMATSRTWPLGLFLPGTAVAHPKKRMPRSSPTRTR
jgi:hypothetical protein